MELSGSEKTIARLNDITAEAQDAAAAVMTAFEAIFDECDAIRAACPQDDAVSSALARIYETGSTQDVIRQRMEKIARIAARIIDPTLPEDDVLLSGPQGGDGGIGQDEINRLLGDPD